MVSATGGHARGGCGGDLRNGRRFVVAANGKKEEEVACEFAVAVFALLRSSARVCGVGRTPPELRCLVNAELGPR